MARVMTVLIQDPLALNPAGDTITLDAVVNINDLGVAGRPALVIPLKIGLVYRTPVQLNEQVLLKAKDWALSLYGVPTNSYDAEYVAGSFGVTV